MGRMNYETLLDKLETAKSGSIDLDEMIWAALGKHDWPLPHYDEDTFWKCRNESDRAARMSTDASSIGKWLENEWPDHRIETVFTEGRARIDVTIRVSETLVKNRFRGPLALSDMARGFAIAAIGAHAMAESLQQKIWKHNIEAVRKKLAPWEKWDIVKVGDYHHAVDHKNRLLGSGVGQASKVHDCKHRIGALDVLVRMRERYEEVFADPEPDNRSTSDGPGL
ncbi:hypothetical protein [Leisingera caerulea]|uniref:hypothetical protein n=1 Tax=Leisingera caerulea TaxID=506591 RepID=UPI000416316C|nr:hypothetical protein [Leisingera caerulea]